MQRVVFFFVIITAMTNVSAQDPGNASSAEASSRKSLLKNMVAQDRGEITAIEPSSKEGGGVFIGYQSGTVMNCHADQSCREFGGTPAAPVERLAVSLRAGGEIVWVTFRQGALYQCTGGQCKKFIRDGVQSP